MDYQNTNTPPPNYGTPNPQQQQPDEERGKTVAVLSYCTLIGWVIAIILHQNDKTKFGAYHLRQGLGAMIVIFGLAVVASILAMFMFRLWLIMRLVQLTGLAFLVIGLINAVNGKSKPLPVIGEMSDKILAGIK